MASIFDLQILNDSKYNFETDKILKNKGTPNKKRQFTEKKDLQLFLKKVETVFGHCKYIRNHIRLYCNNPRYKESFQKFKNVIIMLSFADLKFNKQYNLNKNLKDFHSLFEDVNNKEKNDLMDRDYETLKDIAIKLNNYSGDCNKLQINNIFQRVFLKKLNNSVKNIQNSYEQTHEKLSQHDCTGNSTTDKLRMQLSNTIEQQEAILFYGFALNLKYIKEYHYCIKNDLIHKLKGTELFAKT